MNNFSYGDVVKFVAEFADPTAPEKGTEGRVISSEMQGMAQVAWFPTKECPIIRRTWVWTDQIEKIHWSPCK